MFGGCTYPLLHPSERTEITDLAVSAVAPPQLSEEEIKQMEAEASFTVQQVLVSAVLLYLCE